MNKIANKPIIEFDNLSKTFGTNQANANISFAVEKNTIHAIVGENGAGKTTLMSMLFGLIKPDSGKIFINGQPTILKNAYDAIQHKISMLPQHYKLMDRMRVWENIVLGQEITKKMFLNKTGQLAKLNTIIKKFGLKINLDAKIQNLSPFEKQKVEILKILWRNSQTIIFDEPTSVLSVLEAENFLSICKQLKKTGRTIVFITHKINEVEKIADFCTVLRKGKHIKTFPVHKFTKTQIINLVLGKQKSLQLRSISKKNLISKAELVVKAENFSYKSKTIQEKQQLKNINFEIKSGEIVGIAAIENNGQEKLINLLSGLTKPRQNQVQGTLNICNKNVPEKKLFFKRARNLQKTITHIPEDRQNSGLVQEMSIVENLLLQNVDEIAKFGYINIKKNRDKFKNALEKYDIRGAKNLQVPIKNLSGGNQQKVIVAREIERSQKLLLCVNPTRGLDAGAIYQVYQAIVNSRNNGVGVLLISGELDEILEVADRILVFYQGKIIAEFNQKEADRETIGTLMLLGKTKTTSKEDAITTKSKRKKHGKV